MSNPFSPEQIASLRDNARRRSPARVITRITCRHSCSPPTKRCGGRKQCCSEVRTGEAAAVNWPDVRAAHLIRSVAHAETARRACEAAREQHVSARRLLTHLHGEDAAESAVAREWAPGVLVVDDAADIREIVAAVLRDAGFIVRTAVNGLDGRSPPTRCSPP